MTKECSIEGCTRRAIAKGLCANHYSGQRQRAARAAVWAEVTTCAHCGGELVRQNKGRMYCSPQCKEKARKDRGPQPNTSSCLACGASLAGRRPNAKYCGNACQLRHAHRGKMGVKNRAKTCRGCDGPMPADRNTSALYCSYECKLQSRRHEAYGLTKAELDLLLAQHDACAICATEEWGGPHGKPNVDHDHATGKVRGLLCNQCNNGLGRFKDDPALLRAAISYLEAAAS